MSHNTGKGSGKPSNATNSGSDGGLRWGEAAICGGKWAIFAPLSHPPVTKSQLTGRTLSYTFLRNTFHYIVRFQKLWRFFFKENATFPIIVAFISKTTYFKIRLISKIDIFSKIGLFQKLAHLKNRPI